VARRINLGSAELAARSASSRPPAQLPRSVRAGKAASSSREAPAAQTKALKENFWEVGKRMKIVVQSNKCSTCVMPRNAPLLLPL